MQRQRLLWSVALVCSALVRGAVADVPPPDLVAFRALYKELVETNTTRSAGSCTLAAQRMAAHLTAAGFPAANLHLFSVPDHPKQGGLVAVMHATGATARPILLLAHLDVVEAKREDWKRDPFKLVEEGGYFYARGAADDKAMAAIWIDALVRMRADGFHPTRDIKLALTCDEEGGDANGVLYLLAHQRPWVDAAFAINEGGGGVLDAAGHRVEIDLQVDQKLYQDYRLETTSPGGHSSQPYKPNAIDTLAAALVRIGNHEFPVRLTAVTRSYFAELARIKGGKIGAALTALLAHPDDAAADATVSADRSLHSMLRTTCVSTMISGGHAVNALPQRATANVNCRLIPGTSAEDARAELERIAADPTVTVAITPPASPFVPPTALDPAVIDPARALAKEMFPGIPMLSTMMTPSSDGKYLAAAGIPTFGIDVAFTDPDEGNIHGLDERIRVQSLYEDRTYLERLVRIYAGAPPS